MNRINSRIRILITTVAAGLFYFLTMGVNFSAYLGINWNLNFDPLRHLILGVIIYLGTYWSLFFKIKRERFLTILLFPSLAAMAGSFFNELIIVYVFPSGLEGFTVKLIAMVTFLLFTYIAILTVNILNAHYLNNIPLGQAAKASYFVLSLLTTFILYFILLSNDIIIIYKALAVFSFTVLIVYMCLWSIEYNRQQRVIVAFAIGLLVMMGQLILTAWPINPTYTALILNFIFYFTLNMAMEMREKISKLIWIEYTVLYTLILAVLILLGEWGINGSII